jgi:NitT/TauT family transport system permease protein
VTDTSRSVGGAGAAVGRSERPGLLGRVMAGSAWPVLIICVAILALWYVGAFFLNAPFAREMLERAGEPFTILDLVQRTMNEARPVLPSPHQVAVEIYKTTVPMSPSSKRSLVYHSWVTLSSTLLGFLMGTVFGIALAVAIVHSRTLSRSLMPWVIASQTVPILAIAPVIVVVGYNLLTGKFGVPTDFSRLLAKALISTYLSFFPVAVGVVKGLRSPDPIHLDLMRTYNASRAQVLLKLRAPASVPFLFTSMKVAIAASLVGAIVGELPTGAVAGLGARLLTGSYYGQTVQIWSALLAASLMAGILVAIIGLADRVVLKRMGMSP